METWQTIGVQMGIAGLVIIVGYNLAKMFIATWNANEQAKIKALTEAEAERTKVIAEGFQRVTDVHASILQQQNNLIQLVTAVDAKISAVFDLTPVHGTKVPPEIRRAIETPSVSGEIDDRDDARDPDDITPVQTLQRKTPPKGVPVPRHRTSG